MQKRDIFLAFRLAQKNGSEPRARFENLAEGRLLQGSTYEYDLRKVSDEVRFPALASVVQTTYD